MARLAQAVADHPACDGAVVWVAVEFVDPKTAETWSVPLSHASNPSPVVTVACVLFVGGVISTRWVCEHVVVPVRTSLNPTLK
jgi:hypothetical protein